MVSAALKDLPHPIHPAAYKTANRGRSGYEVSTKLFPAVPSPATYLHDRGFGPGNRTVLCLSAESRNICGRTTSFLDRDSPPRSKGLQTNPSPGCFGRARVKISGISYRVFWIFSNGFYPINYVPGIVLSVRFTERSANSR
jgi:hypothetical protein